MNGKAKNASDKDKIAPSPFIDIVNTRLAIINKINIKKAIILLSLLAARGLSLVLETSLSISLSQRSFATHPNPLTNKPPKAIFIIREKFCWPLLANHKLHPAGINRINLPEGLFQRNICRIDIKLSFVL